MVRTDKNDCVSRDWQEGEARVNKCMFERERREEKEDKEEEEKGREGDRQTHTMHDIYPLYNKKEG